MQPRLKTSKKWTTFPKEFMEQIQTVFKDSFGPQMGESRLIIEGRIYPQELLLRVGILEKGRLKQSNFEVSVDYQADNPESLDRIHHLIDVAGSMMADYLQADGEIDFPYTWKQFPFKGNPIYLQYSTENTDLEAQANALLGAEGEALIHEDATTEDALDRSEKTDLH